MMKKFFTTTLLMIPLFANADAIPTAEAAETESNLIPLEKCNAENFRICDTAPEHNEIPTTEALALDKAWGQAFITSQPRTAMADGAANIEVQVSVRCKNATTKQVVIPKMMICGYPVVRADKPNLDSWFFRVHHEPTLNVTEDANGKIVLRYQGVGGTVPDNDICAAEAAPKVVDNPCLKPLTVVKPPAPQQAAPKQGPR